jgi:hypothetical protein
MRSPWSVPQPWSLPGRLPAQSLLRILPASPRCGRLQRSNKQIGANNAQREWARLTLNELLPITPLRGPYNAAGYRPASPLPPLLCGSSVPAQLLLGLHRRLAVEVDFWKRTTEQLRCKSTDLAQQFREAFSGSILSLDQVDPCAP